MGTWLLCTLLRFMIPSWILPEIFQKSTSIPKAAQCMPGFTRIEANMIVWEPTFSSQIPSKRLTYLNVFRIRNGRKASKAYLNGHEKSSPPLTYSSIMNKRFSSWKTVRKWCLTMTATYTNMSWQKKETSTNEAHLQMHCIAWKAPRRLTMNGCSIMDMICFSAFTCSTCSTCQVLTLTILFINMVLYVYTYIYILHACLVTLIGKVIFAKETTRKSAWCVEKAFPLCYD